MKTNPEIIQALYTHFAARNLEEIKRLFDGQIQWQQMSGFPNGGTYIGFDAIYQHVFQGFSENWSGWKAEVNEYIDAGDSVFALGNYKGTYLKTGRSVEASFAHHYVIEGGKIKSFTQYTDTLLIANAMGVESN